MDILIFFDRKSQKYPKMPQKLLSFAPLTLKPITIEIHIFLKETTPKIRPIHRDIEKF
eukprot:TRINITY_DN355_c1_g1_i1.p2 TRINITY_DN355_c1_g1~~TRINITY_DN355_c1_g1_i1.p2  ORF type:complete len:58 (+),score=4.68 TRINITY_DN355_c1_g1_i1:143-316(+)